QWDPDLHLYYNRARYLDVDRGRFWTMDSYEGSQQDPLSLHKYLYAHDNPVNGIDPSGNDLIQTLTSTYVAAQIAVMNFLVAAGSYGVAETTLAIMALGY